MFLRHLRSLQLGEPANPCMYMDGCIWSRRASSKICRFLRGRGLNDLLSLWVIEHLSCCKTCADGPGNGSVSVLQEYIVTNYVPSYHR